MSGNRKTIQLADNCEWKGFYSDGMFKWSIKCCNTEVLRQRYDEERGACGYCGRPIYFAVKP